MMRGMSKHKRPDEHSSLSLAHDRVPHRRGIAGPLDAQPGPWRRLRSGGDAGLDELVLRRDRAMIRVDEEDTHRDRG